MREKYSLRITFVNFLARNYIEELRRHPAFALQVHLLLLGGFIFLSIWFSLILAAVFYVLLATYALVAIYIAVKFSRKAVTEKTTSLDQRLEAVTEKTTSLDQRLEAVTEKTTSLDQRLEAVTEKTTSLDQRLEAVTEKTTSLDHRLEASNLKTTGRSRSVSPVMPSEDIRALVNEVCPKIGLSFNANQINYLSARVLVADEKIRGRIACPVQTQVLRNMCCLSLTSDTLNVLEIGTLFGGAVVSMFDASYGHFSETLFTMVDPLDGYYQNGADPSTGVPVNESVLHANMIAGGVARENYRLIKGMSEDTDILKMASTQEYDLLLIDGDHGYEGLKSDFINYVPLVKKYGLVLIDDYGNESWPDVKKFIDEELQNSPHLEMITAIFDTAVLRVIEKSQGA